MTTTLSEKTSRIFDEHWLNEHLDVLASHIEKFKPVNLKRDRRTNHNTLEEGASALRVRIQQLLKEKELAEKDLGRMKQKLSDVSGELVKGAATWLETKNDLSAIRAQLEQFTFLSNHDLQEPLRKLQIYTDRLSGPESDLNEYARAYSDKINVSANRMSLLLTDLANFSLSKKVDSNSFEPIDLNVIVQEVYGELKPMILEKNATMRCNPLPVVAGDRRQIKQLFQHLILNALTFNSGNAIIEISPVFPSTIVRAAYTALPAGTDYLCISITDNGIGFDQQYAKKIFTLFQRLRENMNLEGSGTGLSICKQIMENHGGLIYADGLKNVGATFTMFFPTVS